MSSFSNPLTIFNQLIFLERLKSGSFGTIFKARHQTLGEVAVKLIDKSEEKSYIQSYEREYGVLRQLLGEPGFPQLIAHGEREGKFFIVMTLHGLDLFNFVNRSKSRPAMKWSEIIKLGVILIDRLETLHSKGLIHCDIKLDNILFNSSKDMQMETLRLIDFGLTRPYLINGEHIPDKRTGMMVGTVKFCSINSLLGKELSRRDDMESLGYLLLYLLKDGDLPWISLTFKSDKRSLNDVRNHKKKVFDLAGSSESDFMPAALKSYFLHVAKLDFTAAPDYSFLRGLFQKGLSQTDSGTLNLSSASFLRKSEEDSDFNEKTLSEDPCDLREDDDEGPISKMSLSSVVYPPKRSLSFCRFDSRNLLSCDDNTFKGEMIFQTLLTENVMARNEEEGRESILSSIESDLDSVEKASYLASIHQNTTKMTSRPRIISI